MFSSLFEKIKFRPLIPVFLMAVFSLLTLASLSVSDNPAFLFFKKQIVWYGIGFLVFFLISKYFDYRLFCKYNFFSLGFYFLSIFLLISVLVFGSKVRGAVGWFNFGFISFQPAELARLGLIVILSRYLAVWHIEVWRVSRLVISVLYTGVPFVLIFLQPDLGSAIIFIVLWLGMIIISGLRPKHFALLIIVGIVLGFVGWQYFLQDYQKERVISFFNPELDPLGSGYNVIQSKIAIGSGSLFGRGLGQGIETQLKFLPEAKTDFFLAAFIEEWGFFGGLLLCLTIGIFIFMLIQIGLKATDNFARLFIFGYVLALVFQIAINFGANLGFLPITGLPLPFLSYGGSNLLINFISLGIINSIRLKSV